MLAGGLVGKLGEFADEFLEDGTHLRVADGVGMQVDAGELLGDEIEQAGLGEAVDLGVEVEGVENVSDGGRERLHVGTQVLTDVILIAHEFLEIKRRCVEEKLAGLAKQERLGIQPRFLPDGQFGEYRRLGGFEHAVQPAQHGERQDHLAVRGLLVVATQQVGDGPEESGQIAFAHAAYLFIVSGGSEPIFTVTM